MRVSGASRAVPGLSTKRALIDLIRSEDYLFVSDDEAIRNMYVKIRHEIGELYNDYMTIVR